MNEVELLLTEEFATFSQNIANVYRARKAKKEEIKSRIDALRSDCTALDQLAAECKTKLGNAELLTEEFANFSKTIADIFAKKKAKVEEGRKVIDSAKAEIKVFEDQAASLKADWDKFAQVK